MSGQHADERMWKILAKHSEVKVPKAAQTPKAEQLPVLHWRKVGEYAMESHDRRYRISKAYVFDIPHYQAYALPPGGEWYFCLGGDCKSFEDAKAVIERHRRS